MSNLERYGINERFKIESTMYKEYTLGRIIEHHKGIYKVVIEDKIVSAEISGKFRFETEELVKYPAIGDYVMIDLLDENSNSIIHKVLTRKSIFTRTSVSEKLEEQVIATNIDIVFICMSLNKNYNLNRLERYLSIVWDSKAKPVIILTKSDLCDELDDIIKAVEKVSMYSDIVITSMYDENPEEKLAKYLNIGMTAAFVGSSGVGKTTLINRLIQEKKLETKEIGKADKGKHTTTSKSMLVSKYGGVVIDTPGMRELGISSANTEVTFSDIEELIDRCKFSNCTHTNEPGCAILEALENEKIDERRFQNYIKIKNEDSYQGLTAKEIEIKKHERMFKDVGGIKNARKFIKGKNKR